MPPAWRVHATGLSGASDGPGRGGRCESSGGRAHLGHLEAPSGSAADRQESGAQPVRYLAHRCGGEAPTGWSGRRHRGDRARGRQGVGGGAPGHQRSRHPVRPSAATTRRAPQAAAGRPLGRGRRMHRHRAGRAIRSAPVEHVSTIDPPGVFSSWRVISFTASSWCRSAHFSVTDLRRHHRQDRAHGEAPPTGGAPASRSHPGQPLTARSWGARRRTRPVRTS